MCRIEFDILFGTTESAVEFCSTMHRQEPILLNALFPNRPYNSMLTSGALTELQNTPQRNMKHPVIEEEI